MRWTSLAGAALFALFLWPVIALAGAEQEIPLAVILERAAAYVLRYQESSRYNLGQDQTQRTVNAPVLGLLFLLPANQQRFSFERRGTRTTAGFGSVEVAFQERQRPTLVHDRANRDVPARGSFWIDPTRGTVMRTRIEYDTEDDKAHVDPQLWANAVVLTEYRREPGLDIFVPDTMTEWYRLARGHRLRGLARYFNYRRFQVTSEWEVADPKP